MLPCCRQLYPRPLRLSAVEPQLGNTIQAMISQASPLKSPASRTPLRQIPSHASL